MMSVKQLPREIQQEILIFAGIETAYIFCCCTNASFRNYFLTSAADEFWQTFPIKVSPSVFMLFNNENLPKPAQLVCAYKRRERQLNIYSKSFADRFQNVPPISKHNDVQTKLSTIVIKTVSLGDTKSGKTSLIDRYCVSQAVKKKQHFSS